MLAALIARTGASLAVVTFCVTVCGLGAWLAVGWPGTHFLSADTRSMLTADYGPDQHVLTQPPLDTTITQAAQDDVGSSSQAPPSGSNETLAALASTPAPDASTLPLGRPRQTPKPGETGGASSVRLTRSIGIASPTPTIMQAVMTDSAATSPVFRTPLSHDVENPNDISSDHDMKADVPRKAGDKHDDAGANSAADVAHGAANSSDRDARPAIAHALHSGTTPSTGPVAAGPRPKASPAVPNETARMAGVAAGRSNLPAVR